MFSGGPLVLEGVFVFGVLFGFVGTVCTVALAVKCRQLEARLKERTEEVETIREEMSELHQQVGADAWKYKVL